MRSLALIFVMFVSCASAEDAPVQPSEAIRAYHEEAIKQVEIEQLIARYNRTSDASATRTTDALRPLFDAAYEALAGSEDAQEALDEHWLVVNRCLAVPARSCKGDLAAAKAKVDLKLSRHRP